MPCVACSMGHINPSLLGSDAAEPPHRLGPPPLLAIAGLLTHRFRSQCAPKTQETPAENNILSHVARLVFMHKLFLQNTFIQNQNGLLKAGRQRNLQPDGLAGTQRKHHCATLLHEATWPESHQHQQYPLPFTFAARGFLRGPPLGYQPQRHPCASMQRSQQETW